MFLYAVIYCLLTVFFFFCVFIIFLFFFFNDTAPTEIYTYSHPLSLHDALPIFLDGGAGAGDAAVNNPPSDQSTRAAVRRYLSGLMEARAIPGLQIAIVRNAGIELLDMMGLANIEHHVPVIRESIFSVNSMSKAFTGIAVMQLVEDGKLDLAAPISH